MTDDPESNVKAVLEAEKARSWKLLTRRNLAWSAFISVSLAVIGTVYWARNPVITHQIRESRESLDSAVKAAFGLGDPVVKNGFDLRRATVPQDQIFSGGVRRDGIPSLTDPEFVSAAEATYLKDDDLVIGLDLNGEVRAYPLRIIVWHEIINDAIGGKHLAITYCPLCGTCMVFNREVEGRLLTFGVSGLLYQSDVLMFDRQTESLWSQLKMESVSGPLRGSSLEWLSSAQLTWKAWRGLHPETKVLSKDTGHSRAYESQAYASYMRSPKAMFPVPSTRDELPQKDWVVGLIVEGIPKAYPVDRLTSLTGPLIDIVGGQHVTVTYNGHSRWASAELTVSGKAVPVVKVYWFAWQAFYPATEIFAP